MPAVLFIDNAGRSCAPIAAALFAQLAKKADMGEEWSADSAGLYARHGQMIAAEVRTVLEEAGCEPLRIGAQELTPKLVKSADLLLCMTEQQEKEISRRFISSRNKLKTLMSVMRDDADVFDPSRQGVEKFRVCVRMMQPAIEVLVERLA